MPNLGGLPEEVNCKVEKGKEKDTGMGNFSIKGLSSRNERFFLQNRKQLWQEPSTV